MTKEEFFKHEAPVRLLLGRIILCTIEAMCEARYELEHNAWISQEAFDFIKLSEELSGFSVEFMYDDTIKFCGNDYKVSEELSGFSVEYKTKNGREFTYDLLKIK